MRHATQSVTCAARRSLSRVMVPYAANAVHGYTHDLTRNPQ